MGLKGVRSCVFLRERCKKSHGGQFRARVADGCSASDCCLGHAPPFVAGLQRCRPARCWFCCRERGHDATPCRSRSTTRFRRVPASDDSRYSSASPTGATTRRTEGFGYSSGHDATGAARSRSNARKRFGDGAPSPRRPHSSFDRSDDARGTPGARSRPRTLEQHSGFCYDPTQSTPRKSCPRRGGTRKSEAHRMGTHP